MTKEGNVSHQGDLLFGRQVGIEAFFDRGSVDEVLLHQGRDILDGQFLVEDALRLDYHDGALGTEPIATRGHDLDAIGKTSLVEFGLKTISNLETTAGDTACTGTDHETEVSIHQSHGRESLLFDSFQSFDGQLFHTQV